MASDEEASRELLGTSTPLVSHQQTFQYKSPVEGDSELW